MPSKIRRKTVRRCSNKRKLRGGTIDGIATRKRRSEIDLSRTFDHETPSSLPPLVPIDIYVSEIFKGKTGSTITANDFRQLPKIKSDIYSEKYSNKDVIDALRETSIEYERALSSSKTGRVNDESKIFLDKEKVKNILKILEKKEKKI
jgi:hypothetical protein